MSADPTTRVQYTVFMWHVHFNRSNIMLLDIFPICEHSLNIFLTLEFMSRTIGIHLSMLNYHSNSFNSFNILKYFHWPLKYH
jgi:hypothetical protein